MATFGGFAGGLAQSLQNLPGMLQQKNQEELRQKQFAEQMRQQRVAEDTKFFSEGRARLDEVIDTDPTQAPAFAEFLMGQWEEKNNVKAPSLFRKQLKEDPAGTLDALATAGPEKARQVMSDSQAFMNFFPAMLKAKSALKVKEQERVGEAVTAAGPALAEEFDKKFPGYNDAVKQAAVAEAQLNAAITKNAPQAKIAALQARVDSLKEKLDKGMPDGVKLAIAEAGGDPRAASIVDIANALDTARQRGVKTAGETERVKEREKTLGGFEANLDPLGVRAAEQRIAEAGLTKGAEERAKAAEATFSPADAAAQGVAPGTKILGPGGVPATGVPRLPEMVKIDIEDARKDVEGMKSAEESERRISLVQQLYNETDWRTGPISGKLQRKWLESLHAMGVSSETLDKVTSINQLIKLAVLPLVKDLRPVSNEERQYVYEALSVEDAPEAAVKRSLQIIMEDIKYNKSLAEAGSEYLRGDPRKSAYQDVRASKLGKVREDITTGRKTNPLFPGGKADKNPDVIETKKIVYDELKGAHPFVQQVIPAMIDLESGFNPKVTHAADKKGERAVGIGGVKPSSGANFGMGVAPLEDPNDRAGTVRFMMSAVPKLLQRYDGNLKDAMIAYNQGIGTVDAYRAGKDNDPVIAARYKEGEKYYEIVRSKMSKGKSGLSAWDQLRAIADPSEKSRFAPAGFRPEGKLFKNTTARDVGRFGLEAGLGTVGSVAGAVVGGPPGAVIGGGIGAGVGSGIASATFDPKESPVAEAVKTTAFSMVGGAIFNKVASKLVGQSTFTPEGRAYYDMLAKAGRKDLAQPHELLESATVRNLGSYGKASLVMGQRLERIAEEGRAVLGSQADDYVNQFLVMDAKAKAGYQVVDQLSNRLSLKLGPVEGLVKQQMGRHKVSMDPVLKAEWDKLTNPQLGGKATLEQLQVWRSDAWASWRNLRRTNPDAADDLQQTIRFVSDRMDETIEKLSPAAAAAGRQARADWKLHTQGQALEEMILRATPKGLNAPSGETLLSLIRPDKLKKLPTDLAPEQIEFLRAYGTALKASQQHSQAFGFGARMGEVVGVGSLAIGQATPATGFMALAPSAVAKLLLNPKVRHLLIEGIKLDPASEAGYRAGTQLMALIAEQTVRTPNAKE